MNSRKWMLRKEYEKDECKIRRKKTETQKCCWIYTSSTDNRQKLNNRKEKDRPTRPLFPQEDKWKCRRLGYLN